MDIWETEVSWGDEHPFGMGRPGYFSIVIELEGGAKYELGPHDISEWNSPEKLIRTKPTFREEQQKLTYKDQLIKEILRGDPEVDYDGSLILVLENGVTLEHQTTNGDQLYIGRRE